jgi:alkylated DNA repair dioxygenase AlkB
MKGLTYINKAFSFDISIPEENWVQVTGGNRLIQQYGYTYDYNSTKALYLGELPVFLDPLLEVLDDDFNQCIINRYLPGEGISAHIDSKAFGDTIACFTLGKGMMKFTRNGYQDVELYTENKSLYIMTGDARYLWKHEMVKRKSDMVNDKRIPRGERISITFRQVE